MIVKVNTPIIFKNNFGAQGCYVTLFWGRFGFYNKLLSLRITLQASRVKSRHFGGVLRDNLIYLKKDHDL